MIRIGHGYDVHRFGGDGPIRMGGVDIPHTQGLLAHSDGDVAIHALCDALLGALALGDIGRHYPDTAAQYAGIDSTRLLEDVVRQVKQRGYRLGNCDLTIIAQVPRMAPHIEPMRQLLAECLQSAVDQVNIKATTTEGLGFSGRKEGIATHAVVLLVKSDAI